MLIMEGCLYFNLTLQREIEKKGGKWVNYNNLFVSSINIHLFLVIHKKKNNLKSI